jgi:hypothetical protein
VMESHSQNIFQQRRMLMNGLKDLDWTMSDPPVRDAILCVFLGSTPNVEDASIMRKPHKPAKVTVTLPR